MKPEKTLIICACILSLSHYACKTNDPTKSRDENQNNYILDSKSKALTEVESVSNEMEFIGRNILMSKTNAPNLDNFLDCAKISWTNDPDGWIVELIFNTNKICSDGKIRSGKITIAYNKANFDTVVIPEDYHVNGAIINGNFSIDYINGSTQKNSANIVVTNGAIKGKNKDIIEFNLSKKSMAINNDTVIEYTNSSYFINFRSGNSHSFIKANGLSASTIKYECNTFVPINGRIKLEYSSSGTNPTPLTGSSYLNFGTGNCGDKPFIDNYPNVV